ncbi:MAG: GntR family transcriptional regulator [Oscillospiraceae bacterium]|nr:GntR family transcriptional regulator [Oscillospiraceae bacterium]
MEHKVYLQLARAVEDDILSGILREGDPAPSTHQAAERFGVNPATAARGMGRLTEAGLLEPRRGVGLFVAQGARDTIWNERRRAFRETMLVELVEEARKLGVSRQELIAMLMTASH